ncbi:LPD23 domain-containing protein [Ruminococcus sp.]
MISNIDKTESERLNQKLRDIVTGKYQSPAKQRNNFFSTNLNHVQNEDSNLSIVPNGTKDSNGVKHYTLEKNAPAYLPGAEKLFTVRNNIVENQIKSINKQSERNEYYTQKYKDTPKTYEGYMNHAQYVSSDEREWLEKQAEQYATAEDYKKEADKAKADYNYYKNLYVKNTEKTIDALAIQKQAGFLDSGAKIEKRMNEAQDSERIAESKGKEKYYEEKYKDTPKTYEGYMKHAPYVSEEERQWLESHADEFATSEDYKKEIEKAKAEHAYLYHIYKENESNGTTASKSDRKIDDGIISKLNEISKYESKLRKKEYEEKTKDILESDARVRSIVQQYYAYQKNSEQRKSDNDEAVRIDLKSGNKYTPEQEQRIVENFNNLANEGYDPKALYTYYDRAMQEQASIENLQKIQQDAMNNPVGASAWSVLDNAVGSVGDAFKYIGAGIAEDVTGEYQWINTYDTAAARVNTVRSTVSDKIGADIGNETAGKVASFLYQTGMSLADFAATLPLNLVPGVGTGLQMVLLSTEAGTAAAKDAYENTGKASNALMTGVAAGIAEAFFEKFSIENLKAFEAVSPDSLKSVLKNAGKQMFTEASEEGLTTIANTMTDCIINGNMSSIAHEYQGYIDEGYTKEEATAKCAENFGKQVLLDAAGGAVSGGVLGGTVSGISYAKGKINSNIDMKKSAEEIGKEVMSDENFDINLLLEQAKNSGSEKAVSIAKSIEKKMSGNKNYKVNSVDVGNLMKLIGAESLKNTISENTDVKNDGVAANEGNINTVSKEEITEHIKYNFGNSHKNGITATDNKGKSVVIVGFESSARYYGEADNKVRVIADDGRVYNADSLTFNLPEYQSLMNAAKNFDTNGAGTLVQEYGDYVNFKGKESDINNYIDTFTQLYEAGKMGARYNRVAAMKYYGKYIDAIGPQRAMLAVEAGNKDSDLFFNNEEKLARIDRSSNVKANVYVEKSAEETVNLNEGTRLALEKLSEMTGKEIILTADMDENGRIDFRNGKIYIRASLDGNYILPVAMHESMHSFRRESPKDYRLIRNFVVDYLYASGHDVMKMADNVKINYGDRLTTNEDCIEEIVCNSIMAIAGDESAMHKALQVAKADEGVLQKLANAIKNLASKIKEFIITHTTNEAAQAFVNDVKALDKLAEMFSNAADNIKAKSEEVITSEQKNNTGKGVESGDVKYSIKENVKNKVSGEIYDKVVVLDTNIFKGIPPRNWGKTFRNFISKHLIGKKFLTFDENGKEEIIEFAKPNERVTKNGANNSHKVLDKLSRKSDRNSKLVIVHSDEVINISEKQNENAEHSHQWLDENGWEYRNAIVMDKYGKLYSVTLNIAKSKDGRNILYDINKINEVGYGVVLSNAKGKRSSHINPNFVTNSISQSENNVNTKNDESSNDIKYSMGGLKAETADKSALEKAMELEKDGTDSEKIRKETGWFKGYDGKWRFEIDNSELEFKTDIEKNRAAAIELAKMKVKSAELEEKIVNNTATKAEENEYYNLDEKMIEYRKGVKLSDVINHPKLFEAYPQLKNVDVYYEISSVNRGVYSSNGNVIMLNPMHTIDEQKEAIIHEIQHAIQGIENFANGSNLEYWKNLGYSDEEAMAMYYNTAGEREARDVSARRDYNEEQRKNIRPDIDRKDVVFANSGESGYSSDENIMQDDFENKVDQIENNTYNSNDVVIMGRTPKVLQDIGFNSLPVAMTKNHIYSVAVSEARAKNEGRYKKNTNYHDLGFNTVKQIYNKISDPLMVIAHPDFTNKESRDSTHKVIALVDLSVNNKQVIAPILVDYESIYSKKRMDVNLVATYFNKNNINDLIKEAIALENNNQVGFYYLDKKRTQSIIKRTGYQLPRRLNNLSSNIIIRKIDSNVNKKINKITQSQQFVRWFGDWQNKPKTASKVVDGNGEPLVVYHQTGNDFTVFDTKHTGAGEFDSEMPTGIFMKPTNSNISLSGNKQMALYANIRNPLTVNNRAELVRFYEQNIDGYKEAREDINNIDSEYEQKYENAEAEADAEYSKLWTAREQGKITEDEYQKAIESNKLDELEEEWHNKANEASKKAKSLIDDYFRNSNYDGVIVKNDAGSFGRTTKTYIAFSNTQVKSATDNIGTFDGRNSDIRYAVDDTINDWLDDESTPQGIDYEKAVEKNPVIAVAKIYKSAAQTAKSGLAQGKNVKLDEKEYLRIAGSIMQTYGIKGKYNPNYKKELASQLKNFVDSIGKKDANFTDLFEEFVNDCKGGILLSGEYDTTLMREEREFVLDMLQGKVLLIKPRDVQQIEEDYGSVANYRKKMFGKTYVAVKNKESGKGYYIEDVITHIEENYPYLLNENADGDMGYLWLEDLVNNVLKPKYKNPYFEGENSFYETPETAAIQMAFECASEIINAKTEKLKADTKADKKLIKEIETSQKEAINIATEIAEAKNKQYRQELKEAKERNTELWKRNAKLSQEKKEEHRKRVEHSRELFSRLNKEKSKVRAEKNKNAYRNKIIEAQKAIIASHYKTIREEYNEGRNKTEYLHKLGRMCDRLTKRLDGKAKNNEYIPDNLKGPIIDVLSCFTVKDAKNATPGYFGEWNRIKEVGERVAELAKEYNNMKPEPTPSTDLEKNLEKKEKEKPQNTFIDIESISYKEPVNKQLKNLAEMLEGQNIYTLTSHELSAIYDTMKMLDESLRDAVQIIVDGRKQNFKELANEAMQEVKNNKARVDYSKMKNVLAAPAKQLGKSFVATHLDPVRYGRMLSNYHDDSIIYKLFSGLHEGENKAITIQQKAISRIKEVTLKYEKEIKGIQNEDVKEFDFRDVETGRRVPITKGVLLAIYLTDRQKSGHIHLLGGTEETYANKEGHYTVLPNLELSNKKLKRTANENSHKVRFNVESLKRIEKYVQNDKILMELATAISEVYNQTLKQEINEVSMAKNGMKIATVKDYYPLKVDPNAGKYEKNLKTEFHDTRLKSRGFTKQRQWSDTPIVIDDALRNFVKQVKSVSEYCGLLIPIENFKKVYNYSDGSATLHSTIKERYGVSAEHYIDKLIGDLQNRADTTDRTILDKIQSNFMGMKIAFNFGSMIKQVSAFPLANRYFGAKNVSLAAMNLFRNKVDFDLYNKFTSYLWYRKEGNGTVIGELSKEMSLTNKGMGFLDIVSKMDNRVVTSLLYAAELHVEQTTDLKKGTDAFYREVARQFEKCIDESQPNNMITSKPQYLRNKALRLLSLNAFRSQNMAIGNTMLDSFLEMKARMNDYKNNSTVEAKKARKEAILKFVSCCAGAFCSNLLLGALSLLSSICLYHRWDDLFDDEGNISAKNIGFSYINEVLNGIFGSFAMGDYMYDAVSSAIDKDKTFYGLQVMSVDSINDMIQNITSGKYWEFLKVFADCVGVPWTNISRLRISGMAYLKDLTNGRIITDSKGNVNTDYLHYYIVEDKKSGNDKRAEHYENMWKEILIEEKGKTESEATDYIKSKIVTALSADDDIEEAGVAKANGNLADYEKYRQKVIDYGFDSKDVQKAIDRFIKSEAKLVSEIEGEDERKQELIDNGFNEKGAEFVINKINESKSDDETGSTSVFDDTSEENELVMYSYSDLFDALINGDTENYSMIENYLIEKGGKTKKEIKSAMRSTSRTDKLWGEYIEASTGNDRQRTRELVTQLTRIYGSWENAKTALKKYQNKIK